MAIEPQEIDRVRMAFPASVADLMPAWDDIPEEFRRLNARPWSDITSEWFFRGLPGNVEFYPTDGIDPAKAIRHLKAILGSFEPKHEHKEAAVAYLMSQWFEKVENWDGQEAEGAQ